MTDTPLPTLAVEDGVAVITLDDGKANVFSDAVVARLEDLLDEVEAGPARSLVLVGRPGKFSAGFDLGEMTASLEGMRALVSRGARWWARLYGFGLPTVAACTGHALAGGAITLLACDVRIGADLPAKIGLSEVAIGMPLPKFAVELARDRLTKASFTMSTMGATVYDPAGAASVGYLDRVVPEDELLAEALETARALGALSTGAFARTKTNVRGAVIAQVLAELDADMASVDGPST